MAFLTVPCLSAARNCAPGVPVVLGLESINGDLGMVLETVGFGMLGVLSQFGVVLGWHNYAWSWCSEYGGCEYESTSIPVLLLKHRRTTSGTRW